MSEEWAFLKAILEQPDDNARKLVYADWLEDQGDPRSEYLRLMMKVRQERIITPEQRQKHKKLSGELAQERQEWENAIAQGGFPQENRERQRRVNELESQLADLSRAMRRQIPARLQELAATLDPKWLAVVSDPEIEGCGKSTGGGWSPRFSFVCDRSWADMTPTGDDNVRHCEACSRDVHFCETLADAREHSHEGHCIAVDLGIIRREDDLTPPMLFVGHPSKEHLRQSYEEGVDPVSQARLNARKNRT